MSASTAVVRGCDPWEMTLIHGLIKNGYARTQHVVLAADGDDQVAAVAEYVRFHLDALHMHHATEDELIWPLLLDRAGLVEERITRMEAQHAALDEVLVRADSLLSAWASGPSRDVSRDLAEALGAVRRLLDDHLAEEERDVVPLIAAHVTKHEWEAVGEAGFAKFTPMQQFIATGEMFTSATGGDAERMMDGLPLPIRLIWRFVGRRRYGRLMARLPA